MSEKKIQSYVFAGYRLDLQKKILLWGDSPVRITQKSLEVLRFLIENRGEVLNKELLLENIWNGIYVEEKTLMQHIYVLRKAFKQNESGKSFIRTVPKKGYCFVADVTEVYEDPQHAKTPLHRVTAEALNKSSQPADRPSERSWKPRNVAITVAGLFLLFMPILLVYLFSEDKSTKAEGFESLAVLPLRQIGNEANDNLGLGIADILITRLGESENLLVTPTRSIIRYHNRENLGLFDVGNKLNVDAVLDGTIQKERDLVRTTVRLYDVKKKRQIWTGTFDGKYSDIFSLQEDIAARISTELSLKLVHGKNTDAVLSRYSQNMDAYTAYLDGLYSWNRRSATGNWSTKSNHPLNKAIEKFQLAIDEDPDFALAYAYLSDSYALVYHYRMDFILPRKEALRQARVFAKKAVEIDPDSSEALAAMAFVYNKEGKNRKSRQLLRTAITANPNNANARKLYAWQILLTDDVEGAVEQMRVAQRLDPQSATVSIALAQILNFSRQPERAVIYAQNGLRIAGESISARLTLAESFEQMGKFENAIEQLEKVLENKKDERFALLAMSRIYAKSGNKARAEKIFEKLIKDKVYPSMYYSVATNYLAFGKPAKTIEWIQKKGNEDRTNMFYYNLQHDYDLDSIRNTPAFQNLIENERRISAAQS